MYISENGINFIKKWEGCKLEAYEDVKGIWTIGIGSIGDDVYEGLVIDEEEAIDRFKRHINPLIEGLNKSVKGPITQNMFDAVCSLSYNIGLSAFNTSTCLKKLKINDYEGAADAILLWNKIKQNGKMIYVEGLHKRRLAEKALFLS